MPRYPFTDWIAEQLRLTGFRLPGAPDLAAEQWWEAVVGAPADESTANPKLGLKTLASTFDAGKLVLKLELGRIDWLFVPRDPDPTAGLPSEFPSIGPIAERLEVFSDIVTRWLGRNDAPDLVRLAFGTVVRHPEPDDRAAYSRLPDYLPIRVDPESSDFSFQINIPTRSRSGIDGLRINRLSRWSVMALARVAFQFNSVKMAAMPTPTTTTDYALRLELDINTAPEFQGSIPKGRLIEVYRELVSGGQNIIAEGLPQ
jgi:hypothetical protein